MGIETLLKLREKLPRYQSHKIVRALKIATCRMVGTDTTTDENPIVELFFEEPGFAPLRVTIVARPMPEAGWYLVIYEDSQQPPYWSFSPASPFDEGYTRIDKSLEGICPHCGLRACTYFASGQACQNQAIERTMAASTVMRRGQ